MGIDPGAWIAVPIPDAPQFGAGLIEFDPKSPLAQAIKLIQAGEARADDNHVIITMLLFSWDV